MLWDGSPPGVTDRTQGPRRPWGSEGRHARRFPARTVARAAAPGKPVSCKAGSAGTGPPPGRRFVCRSQPCVGIGGPSDPRRRRATPGAVLDRAQRCHRAGHPATPTPARRCWTPPGAWSPASTLVGNPRQCATSPRPRGGSKTDALDAQVLPTTRSSHPHARCRIPRPPTWSRCSPGVARWSRCIRPSRTG